MDKRIKWKVRILSCNSRPFRLFDFSAFKLFAICFFFSISITEIPTMAATPNPILLLAAVTAIAAVSSAASSAHPAYDSPATSCSTFADADLVPIRREEYDGGRILDISHAYREDMPAFASDDGVGQFLWLPKSMKNGSIANNSEMKFGTHTGTHVDAPGHVFQHYFEAGFDVDTLDLAILNGMFLFVSFADYLFDFMLVV